MEKESQRERRPSARSLFLLLSAVMWGPHADSQGHDIMAVSSNYDEFIDIFSFAVHSGFSRVAPTCLTQRYRWLTVSIVTLVRTVLEGASSLSHVRPTNTLKHANDRVMA